MGCHHLTAACENCYAEDIVNWLMGGEFGRLRYYPERLAHLPRFRPFRGDDGLLYPHLCFVNSMSDFWHPEIPLDFIHNALDAFEQYPTTVFQILTKRPARMRRIITDRYGQTGLPEHFWLGVTCEDNRVKRQLDILRDTKHQVGGCTAFTSIEPITAPTDKIDLTDIDWALTGGESGRRHRPMEHRWLEDANENALSHSIPLHFKQYGHESNNPLVQRNMRRGMKITAAFEKAVADGEELASEEKGGATYKGRLYRDKPPRWHALRASLNPTQPKNGKPTGKE